MHRHFCRLHFSARENFQTNYKNRYTMRKCCVLIFRIGGLQFLHNNEENLGILVYKDRVGHIIIPV